MNGEELTQDNIENHSDKESSSYDDEIFSAMGTSFSKEWVEMIEEDGEAREKVGSHVSGRCLIDLGGGSIIGMIKEEVGEPPMQDLSKKLGASSYVLVDRYLLGSKTIPSNVREECLDAPGIAEAFNAGGNENIEISYRNADMLDFLKYLPSGLEVNEEPVTLSLNGIDKDIIDSDEYHQELANEIFRVLPDGGSVLARCSDAQQHFETVGLSKESSFENGCEIWVKEAKTD